MPGDSDALDLAGLSSAADVSIRTVRYYIAQGLLPAPETRGPGAHYGHEHLERLVLIRRLQREHLPLSEIRRRLDLLRPDDIRALARAAQPRKSAREYLRDVLSRRGHPARGARPRPMMVVGEEVAPPHERPPTQSRWDRIVVASDVEVHIRRPLSREQNRQVDRLIDAARAIFGEQR